MRSPGAATVTVRGCALLVFAVAAERAVAQTAIDEGGGFRAELAKISELAEQGDASEGLAELARVLEAHRGADYARRQRAEIVELDRRLRFQIGYRAPEPGDVVSGEVESYHHKQGSIKLRYRPDALADFETPPPPAAPELPRRPGRAKEFEDELERMRGARTPLGNRQHTEVQFHTALFKGRHSISIKGDHYPREGLRVVVCMDRDAYYDVHVGVPPSGSSSRFYGATRILRVEKGRQPKTLLENHWGADDSKKKVLFPMKLDEPYTIEVSVQDSRIVVSHKRRRMAVVKKARDEGGRFGFVAPGFSDLRVEGRVEPSWIQNRIDAVTQESLATFKKDYAPEQSLPAWLFVETVAPPPPATVPQDTRPFPADIEPAQRQHLDPILDYLEQGHDLRAFAALRKLPDGALPETVRAHLTATAQARLKQPEKALPLCDQVCAAAPDYLPARVLRAQLYTDLGRWQQAVDELEVVIRLAPQRPDAHQGVIALLLRTGRPAEARIALERAKKHVAVDAGLRSYERLLVMAEQGPAWPRRFTVTTTHYEIASDIDTATCHRAGRILEQGFAYYQKLLKRQAPKGASFRVFVFSGLAGYDAYCKEIVGDVPMHTSGLYSPALQQLLIWNVPSRDEMLTTIRHEGLHQYLDGIMDDPPPWLNEGLAEFFETSASDLGIPDGGRVQAEHVELLTASPTRATSVENLIWMNREEFYRNPGLHYAKSWALVRLLRKGSRAYRELFDVLFDALCEGKSNGEALTLVFDGVDMDRLEADLAEHVQTIR